MVRPSSAAKKKQSEAETARADPVAEERRRLRDLALSHKLLSRTPAKPSIPLEPSKTVLRHQGKDIVKKGQRKNRFLFSFPGLLAPLSGGRIGELSDLGTKNPKLYLDFPQGRMKLFGTIVYPRNKYLTLQFGRTSKSVMCEDSFENMVKIVFSDAWWIGKKEENPEEVQLKFPKEFLEGKNADHDFKGGAGAASGETATKKPGKEHVEPLSPEAEAKDDVSDDSDPSTGKEFTSVLGATPVRHSARTAGKKFKFAESSPDDPVDSDADLSEVGEEKVKDKIATSANRSTFDNILLLSDEKIVNCSTTDIHASEDEKDKGTNTLEKFQHSSVTVNRVRENSADKQGSLKQATISSLFGKVEKKLTGNAGSSTTLKGSVNKKQLTSSKKTQELVKGREKSNKGTVMKGKESGTKSGAKRKHIEVKEEDDIEEISSESKDEDDSDEEWGA
ncbi:DNA-binding protein RHL1 [Acorus gramineus]|uniref:DNA-binding protein RHL1 n=1 Tax=Acorus gramineus TaxID=55184 RepID=A0AAV9ACN4_ACOGR|nr:DNA-binding protein RHL1 [Acorus gramineus]